jgi:hypothetical protein
MVKIIPLISFRSDREIYHSARRQPHERLVLRTHLQETCVCRKSDSAILVMKASKDRLGCDDAEALNRPMEGGILVERAMNARFIIGHLEK